MLHVSIFCPSRPEPVSPSRLTPQGLNFADSPCELVVVPHHAVSELPLLTFLWGHILMTSHRSGLTVDFFDPYSSSSPDHGHPELNHAPCGIVALYPSLVHR